MRPRTVVIGGALWLAATAVAGCAQTTHAVACTCIYGGEAKRLLFPPTREPYTAVPVDIAGRFRFKVVYLREPWRAASVNVYAYAQSPERDILLQEGKYLPPFSSSASGGHFGFTGRQLVYSRDQRELEYWCELSP